jgi:hypothetical protein
MRYTRTNRSSRTAVERAKMDAAVADRAYFFAKIKAVVLSIAFVVMIIVVILK